MKQRQSIEIPRHWTPEQALVAFELIELIRDEIWRIYDTAIQAALRDNRQSATDPRQKELLAGEPF